MKLVVGLGNPGREYDGTRHNVGFEVIELLARRFGFPASRAFKKAEVSKGRIGEHDVLLAQPMTYMNLSGDAVGAIMRFYKVELEDVVVVHDELDFEPGEVRLKVGGGHGGHNGLRSIMSHGGRDFIRIRVGVGKPPASDRGADHVLTRFSKEEREQVDEAVNKAAEAVELVLTGGLQKAMNRFNRKPKPPKAEVDQEADSADNGSGEDAPAKEN